MITAETVTITRAEYEQLLAAKSQVAYLSHQLAELKRLIFGAKSERFIASHPDQATLFDLPAETLQQMPTEEITYTRTKPQPEKKQPLRLELPSHLERRVEVIEPENLPEGAKNIGEAVTEVLEYEPASAYVRRIVRRKYIVEQTDEETRIVIAPLPTLPIPKGNAGASMISHLLVSKFIDHLPFFRQVQMFKRQNLEIAESTINGWFNAGCDLLTPLYTALKTQMLSSDYLMADETPIPVQTKDKPGSTHKGYHWVTIQYTGWYCSTTEKPGEGRARTRCSKNLPGFYRQMVIALTITLKSSPESPCWPAWLMPGASSSMHRKTVPPWREWS
jgi:transposase